MARKMIYTLLTALVYLLMIALIIVFSGGDAAFFYEGF